MRVCHVIAGNFLAPSETFIYRRVSDPDIQNSIVAIKRINASKYPLAAETNIYLLTETPNWLQWINERLMNHFAQSPWYTSVIARQRPDVVHAHYSGAGWIALPACKKTGTPLIVTLYGSDFHTVYHEQPEWKRRTDRVFQEAQLITVISDYMKEEVAQAGCPKGKLIRIRCGIDLSELQYKKKHYLKGEPLRILCVARLHPVKRIEDVIQAAARLQHAGYPFDLRLIGDGPERDRLQKLAQELGVSDHVHFLLNIPRAETVANFEWCHVLVLASKMESQGIVLQEAQATGSPVIGTRAGAIGESLLEDQSGFLVPVAEPAAIASALVRFAEEPRLIPQFGEKGRRFVEERFDVRVEWARLREAYARMGALRYG